VRTVYSIHLKNLTLCLIFDGPIKFLSIPHQIHSNSLLYLNLNSLTLEIDSLDGTGIQIVFTLAIWTVTCVTLSVYLLYLEHLTLHTVGMYRVQNGMCLV
jgi:hypothetical protein